MNREIKFRAWDERHKEMMSYVEILLISENAAYPHGRKWMHNCIDWEEEGLMFNPILMQFTGIYDKNGNEIYECDILKVYDWSLVPKFLGYGSIVWDEDETGWNLTNMNIEDRYDFRRCFPNSEIVGNIYENPELIK